MVSINFFWKSEHFDIWFVFVAVQGKKVTNFLLVAVRHKAHRQSSRGLNPNSNEITSVSSILVKFSHSEKATKLLKKISQSYLMLQLLLSKF